MFHGWLYPAGDYQMTRWPSSGSDSWGVDSHVWRAWCLFVFFSQENFVDYHTDCDGNSRDSGMSIPRIRLGFVVLLYRLAVVKTPQLHSKLSWIIWCARSNPHKIEREFISSSVEIYMFILWGLVYVHIYTVFVGVMCMSNYTHTSMYLHWMWGMALLFLFLFWSGYSSKLSNAPSPAGGMME